MTPVSPPTPDDPRATHEAAARVGGVIERLASEAGFAATCGFTPDEVDEMVQSAALDLQVLVAAAERTDKLEEALTGVQNAYGCFAGCTGALPGAPTDGSGHTIPCADARALLSPVWCGMADPDGALW